MRFSTRRQQFLAVARLTVLEITRQPLCLLLALTCVALIALVPLVLMHNLGEDTRLARDSALALHFTFGLIFAGEAASAALSRELRRGTAAVLLSKPFSRELLFLAKFAGVAAAVLLFSAAAALATLLSDRVAERFVSSGPLVGYVTDWITGDLLLASPLVACGLAGYINYRRGRPYGSTAFGLLLACLVLVLLAGGFYDRLGHFAPYHPGLEWRILPVSLLMTLALLVLSAVAITLSTRLSAVPTVTLCSVLFVLGLLSDYLFGRHAASSHLAGFLYRLTPNWQHFWLADALRQGGTVPWTYVGQALLYAAAYAGAVLSLGTLLFRHTEVR